MLLFSTPALFDPNFRRTVVLVAEHGEDGAMGIVLNRPSETTVGEAVPDLADVAGPTRRLRGRAGAAAGRARPRRVRRIVAGGGGGRRRPRLPAADGDLDELAETTRRARVFAGYSGWSPGQLESELEEESWLVEPVETSTCWPMPRTISSARRCVRRAAATGSSP